MSEQKKRVVAGSRYAAAWGDPAIVLRCGVPQPVGFDAFSECQTVNGIDWFIPAKQADDPGADLLMTAVGRSLRVEVSLPAEYRPPADVLVDIGKVLARDTRSVRPCH